MAGVTLSVILGWLLGFAWRFLVNLAAFWSPNAKGWDVCLWLAWVLSVSICHCATFPIGLSAFRTSPLPSHAQHLD